MFKNVKKALFALVLALVAAFAFACGKDEEVKEANNENCKEFCETCPTCNNASAETCKEFCPAAPTCNAASKETCKAFQDFVAPTGFFVDGDTVVVGATKAVYVDDELWEPEDCDKTLVYISEDPTIATVDANGVVTGVRPGKVNITVYSPLNKDLEAQVVEFEVKESLGDQAVVDRELDTILAALPSFVAGKMDLPTPWNTNVKVSYKIAGQEVTALDSSTVEADTMVKLNIALELNDAATSYQADIWLVKDAVVNEFVVIDSVASLLNNYFDRYVKGEKVAADLDLLPSIYGCTINWTSDLATAIATDGKFGAPSEDKSVTLTAGIRYGSGSRNIDFHVVAKGYTAEEKADEIMASTFAKMAGKSFNTSIVLPEFDDKFGAKLSYTSLDTAVYDNTGKLVAAVTEAKDVKFKVKIEYDIASKAADNFTAERELTIRAIPANAASQFLEAALATEGYKKYQKVVYAPWGQTAGNIVFEALPGMVWDVEAVKLDARLQDGYQVFSQASAGAALKLDAQYLRYQLVSIKGTYTYNETTADIVLFFNIGISKTPQNIISGIWRSSAQKDTTLSEKQGKYDLAGNVSYFDKKIGYVTETYGSGYFSGWSVSAERDLGASLSIAKVPGSTNDPAWKCVVADKIEGADYSGINKLLVDVQGPKDEKLLIKTNDTKEDWVVMTGEKLELSIDLAITFDTTKFPMVLFCNPGDEGTGHEFVITKMQLTGTDKVIDLLNGTTWKSLDEGVYNVNYSDGKELWQTFMMEVMTVYIREKDGKVYIDPANVNGGIAGAGGNWGVWYVNTTDKPVNIEVGVYGDATLTYKEGHATSSAVGSRLNIAMDGYALGFVADKDGKIINGSNNSKLQNGMPDMRGVLGGKTYKAGDKVSAAMFNAMQLDGKAEKFEAVYTAADNLLFTVSETGTFKKVTADDGTVSYVAIKEGEEVTEKFAPTYAKGAALTAEQYAALDADTKALVTVEYKAKEAVTYNVPNLFGDSSAGTTVNYLTIPANGYAMSWKYQFYGVGVASTVYPFCQEGSTLNIEHFQVHPLSSMDAEYATNYVKAAEELLEAAEIDHVAFETNVNAARARYNNLSGDTLADVFPAARLTALEAQASAFIDADITALLADEPEASADRSKFAQALATMWARLYKTEGDAVVNKLSNEITGALTKKAAFDAKYAEYAQINLAITYDYNGGFAQGFIKYTDKELVLAEFKQDFYEFLVEINAWEALGETAPTLEVFMTNDYWDTNYHDSVATPKSKILITNLFLPKVASDGTVNENYHDVIENATTFFNSEKGHKWIELMDYVNEATEAGNRGTQDAWARNGEEYLPYYYVLAWKDYDPEVLTIKYGTTNKAIVENKGTTLGAYRFGDFVLGKLASADYKSYIPNNVWSTVFDREATQKNYSHQTYHCTDLTVKLFDEPYKEGYKFLGWKFADGKDAVITGSMFADVTVYAAWAPALEDLIEADLKVQLEGVFYGPTANVKYTGTTATGTIADQVKTVGLGDYAIITGGKLFVIPKFAGIELGKDATADVTLDTKDAVQVYGTDGTTQFSCGLVMGETAPTPTNSYGHGALYHNAGEFKVTITEVKNTYGRNLGGAAYGYDRFLFHFDAEKQLYVGTKVSAADGTSVTLEPGDFLWCPMTADRFCSGLTNCDGTSGVVGVWNGIENPEAQIISTKKYLPAESPKFFDIVFMVDNLVYAEEVIMDEGEQTAALTLPAAPKRSGYDFKGWATKKDATIEEVVEVPTAAANAVYYAVWEKMDRYSEMTVDAAYEGTDPTTFTNLNDALKHIGDNCVITIKAGTYAANATVLGSVKILGPNAERHALDKRLDEAIITGIITIEDDVNNVEISGLKFTGAGQIRTVAGEGTDATTINNTGLTFANNIFDKGEDTTAAISIAKGNRFYSKDVVIAGSSFTASALADKAVVYLDNNINLTVKDCTFDNMPKNAVGVYDTSNGVGEGGSAIFTGNTFKNITGSAIWLNWASPLADYKATAVFEVFNNYLENVGGAAAVDIEGANANTKYASCNIHHNTFKEVFKCLWLDKVLEGKFNYNKIYTPTKASYYFAKGTSGYPIDCTKNLYLSTDGATVITAPKTASSGAFNAATNDTAETDNFATVAAYEAALIEKYGVVTFEEFENMLFADYKAYLNNTEDDLATFKSNWINKVEGKYQDKLYAANQKGVINDELATFANSTAWGDKYLPVIDAFDAYVSQVNSAQSAWASAWTGNLRIHEYFAGNVDRKTFARDQMLIAAINKGIENVAKAANLTTVAAWNHDATAALECKDLNIWSAANYDNYVFLFTGKTAPTYWYRIYLKEYYNGFYEVVAIKAAGESGSTDDTVSFTILANNATDVAALEALGAKVGDFITIPAEAVASEAVAFETPFTVTLYKKPAE